MLTPSTLLRTAHAAWREYAGPGDTVLDATAGNGHDTLFLAGLIEPEGLVLAVDKQDEALARTAARLEQAGLSGRARLLRGDHRELAQLLAGEIPAGGLALAVFNLGFLPGSDKTVKTDAVSTVAALDGIWPLLRPGGLLSVHAYAGHEGAREEAAAVSAWMKTPPWREAQVTACVQWNKTRPAETLYLAAKPRLK